MYGGGRKWFICFNSNGKGPTIWKSPCTKIWPKVPVPVTYQLPQSCCITDNHKAPVAYSNKCFCFWVCGLGSSAHLSRPGWGSPTCLQSAVGLLSDSADLSCAPSDAWGLIRQLGCLGSAPYGLSSSDRLTKLVLMNKKEIRGTQAFRGLGPELAQPHLRHILSAKASHKASPDSIAGKALRTHTTKSVNIGRG